MVFSSVCNVLVRISCVTYTWRTRLNFYFVVMAEYISGPSSVYTYNRPATLIYPTTERYTTVLLSIPIVRTQFYTNSINHVSLNQKWKPPFVPSFNNIQRADKAQRHIQFPLSCLSEAHGRTGGLNLSICARF